MRLKQPLLKLRKQFCAETLSAEVKALPPSAWVPHPGKYPGNDAVPLITPNGQLSNAFSGPMMPTEHLRRCPYIMEVMREIGAVWGRSRLMGLAADAEVPPHIDVNYHWRTHVRLHVPVITNPGVIFTVADESIHMKAGECWIFDSFKRHDVQNRGSAKRVHLVLDTVGGEALWDLVEEVGSAGPEPRVLRPGETRAGALAFEQFNAPGVMSPWEICCHVAFIADHAPADPRLDAVFRRLEKFACAWTGVWAQFGPSPQGIPAYRRLVADLQENLKRMPPAQLELENGIPVSREVEELIFKVALPAGPAPSPQPAVTANWPGVARFG